MKQIRDLLMDCRIELRKLVRDFHKTELCKRIDDARDLLLNGPIASAASAASTGGAEGADRVAQAWQASAEDLRLTAPAIYELLAKKVALRLAAIPPPASATTPDEPVADITGAAAATALATSAEPIPVAPATAAPVSIDVEAHIPNQDMLTAIAANKRRFTEAQREWCVGEAMVRSGFSIDPEEFMARGDSEMARYILGSEEE